MEVRKWTDVLLLNVSVGGLVLGVTSSVRDVAGVDVEAVLDKGDSGLFERRLGE